jgi:hypothetical protein
MTIEPLRGQPNNAGQFRAANRPPGDAALAATFEAIDAEVSEVDRDVLEPNEMSGQSNQDGPAYGFYERTDNGDGTWTVTHTAYAVETYGFQGNAHGATGSTGVAVTDNPDDPDLRFKYSDFEPNGGGYTFAEATELARRYAAEALNYARTSRSTAATSNTSPSPN